MLKKKDKGKSPMDAALGYLTARPRTVLEMETYLDAQHYGEYEVYQVVERLKELGYLNDAQYAADFVRTRLATRAVSRRRLREQLYAHKLDRDAIDTALATITDEEERASAAAIAEKYARQFAALPPEERYKRVLRRLVTRGYDYETVRACMGEADFTQEAYEEAMHAEAREGGEGDEE